MTDPQQPWPASPPMEPPSAPSPPAEPATGQRDGRVKWLGLAVVLLTITTLAFAGLWFQARGEASDLQAKQDRRTEAAAAAAKSRPDLYQAAQDVSASSSDVEYDGDEESLDITIAYPSEEPLAWLHELLDGLGFPRATVDRMEQTRALDGTLEAEGDHASATWTYHPDDGLSVVLSVED